MLIALDALATKKIEWEGDLFGRMLASSEEVEM